MVFSIASINISGIFHILYNYRYSGILSTYREMDKLSYEFMDSCALVKFYNGTSGYFSFGYYVTGGGLQI